MSDMILLGLIFLSISILGGYATWLCRTLQDREEAEQEDEEKEARVEKIVEILDRAQENYKRRKG